jgi:hypothetical protein
LSESWCASRSGDLVCAAFPETPLWLGSCSLFFSEDKEEELLGAAAAARAQILAAGPTDAGALALSRVVGDGAGAAVNSFGAERKALLDAQEEGEGAGVVVAAGQIGGASWQGFGAAA